MHFDVEHDFAGTRAQVADVLCDPAFQTQLELPDLSRPEVVASSADGATRRLRLRYEYTGELDPVARQVVGGRKLTWIQELELDTISYTGTLTFAAESDPDRLGGTAAVMLVEVDDVRCRRRISGDLRVKLPLVGSTAERRIVPGLVRRLDVEAAALQRELEVRDG
jgi:hypothetical protein